MAISYRRCSVCSREYALLFAKGEYSALDRDDIDNLSCPACDSKEYQGVIKSGTGIKLGGAAGVGRVYPYFDRALGVEVQSDTHRRQLCRERGLIPTDGDLDLAAIAREDERQAEEDEKVYNEYIDEMTRGPNKEAYGKLQDMIADGWMPPDMGELANG